MEIRIDKDKLNDVMERRGFGNYQDVEAASRKLGTPITTKTIYNIANNRNWTRDSLTALCTVLRCDPRDFMDIEHGDNGHTHGTPQSGKVAQEQIEPA